MGEFSRQPLILGLDFHLIFIFYLHRALYKIHTWKFFVYGNIIARGKIKCGKTSLGEKKQALRRKKWYHFVKKRKKIPLWKRSVPAELHAGVQKLEVAVKPTFAIRDGHYCVVLLNARRCLRWVTFPGKSWFILIDAGRFPCPIGLRKTNRGREDLLAWLELFANLYELKSRI